MCTTHGRGDGGITGHVYDSARKRSLCGVETSRPWLNWEFAEGDNCEDISGAALTEWLSMGAACGTCVRLYRRACARVGSPDPANAQH